MPPLAIAIAGGIAAGGVGAVGQVIAGNKAADAADRAANAQLTASREQVASSERMFSQNMAERRRLEGVGAQLGEMTTQELSSINRLLQTKELGLTKSLEAFDKEQKVLDDIDPIIKESGKQTLDLLRGKTAEYLKPMMDQRTRQRLQLEEQLSRRLGPGFRTSSAGIEALTRFDTATNEVTMQAQQTALKDVGTTFFTSLGLRPKNMAATVGDIFGRAASIDTAVSNIAQNQAGRKAQAVMAGAGSPVNFGMVPAAYNSVVGASANVGAGDAIQAKQMSDLFGDIGKAGISIAGKSAFGNLFPGGGGGAAPGGGGSIFGAGYTGTPPTESSWTLPAGNIPNV